MEADESKAVWLSGNETGLIPVLHSFEPSGTESDTCSLAATSSDGFEAQQTFRFIMVNKRN